MKYFLMLMLMLLGGGAFAATTHHSSATPGTHQVVSLTAALHATDHSHSCASATKLAWASKNDAPGFGETYCRKMAACCDAGNASCCSNYNKFCNP